MKYFSCLFLLLSTTASCFSQVLSNNGAVVNISSGGVLSGGSLASTSGTVINSGTASLADVSIQSGGMLINAAVLNVTGNIAIAGTFTSNGSSSVAITGTGVQTISHTGSFNNLVINKTSGSTTLSTNATVAGILTFTSGKIATGSNTLIIPNGGTIAGAGQSSGWVDGKLQKHFSSTTNTFEVGSSSYYSPLDLVLSGISANGSLIVSSTSGFHPDISSSKIVSGKNINRYWNIAVPASGYVVATSADVTFNWNSADNYSPIIAAYERVAWYNTATSSWTYPTISGTPTTTNITATGLNSLGDFTIGEITGRKYVNDASTTGDTYTAAVGNNSNLGTVSAPFLTISHALSIANAGDSIYVDAGTYNEQIVANKKIELIGANGSISPNTGTRVAESILHCTTNSSLSVTTPSRVGLRGFKVATNFAQSISSSTADHKLTLAHNLFDGCKGASLFTPDSLSIIDNRFTNIDGATDKTLFVQGDYNGTTGSHMEVYDNTWINSACGGMNISSVSGSIHDNIFDNIAYNGVLVANYSNFIITRNTFTNITNPNTSVSTWGAGVRFYTPAIGMTTDVRNNIFTNNYVGIGVRPTDDVAGRNISANNNYFSGNTFANINHTGAGQLLATCNWYGSANDTAILLSIQGDVDYDPYLVSGTDYDPATLGFQPFPGSCTNFISQWTGATSTDWFTPSNWSISAVPTSYINAVIPSGLTNYPLLTAGSGEVKNLTLQSGGALTLNGGALKIVGSMASNGSFAVGNGSIELNGTIAQAIPAAIFTGNEIRNLTLNNSAGVTLNGPLSLTGVLKATTGNFATGGYLTLASTLTRTALVDGSGSGAVLGTVNMQRYLSSGFGYRYLSSPFAAATVDELADDLFLGATFPTLYRYEEDTATSGWMKYTATSGALVAGRGYAANVDSTTAPKTLDMTGTVNNGTVSFPALFHHNRTYTQGFNLVGNPYPSPIDWDASSGWTKVNVDNAIYYFDNGISNRYVGTYSSYINGVSSNGVANGIIPAMQGFFVHVTNGTYPVSGSLSTTNSVRVNNLTPVYHRTTASETPLIRLVAKFDSINLSSDAAVVYFDEYASLGYESGLDALKIMNTDEAVPNLYTQTSQGNKLSINAIATPHDSVTIIPLSLELHQGGQIEFNARDIENIPVDMHVYLADFYVSTNHDLQSSGKYRLHLDKGIYENRFALVFSRNKALQLNRSFELLAYARDNTVFVYLPNGRGEVVVSNIFGQVLHRQEIAGNGFHSMPFTGNPGLYVITLVSASGKLSKKIFLDGK